jgi:outer membrane protein assembly factor BamB
MKPEQLARSVWPRFGGDTANCSNAGVPGPHGCPELQEHSLPKSNEADTERFGMSGVVVAADGSLRICHAGVLSAWGPDFIPRWQLDLAAYSELARPQLPFGASLPTVLADGSTLVQLRGGLLRVSANGAAVEVFAHDAYLDDSGMSPNVTDDGYPLMPCVTGELIILRNGMWATVGDRAYGFDFQSPALYSDGSLAVAGYYGTGFCRVDLDGTIRWQTDLYQADLLPTVNHGQVAAVGSLNEKVSTFFAPDGSRIGRYPRAAVFAAYGDDWIALSEGVVARVTKLGEELWAREVSLHRLLAGVLQPIVDADGYIYIRHDAGVLCCAADGATVFELALPATLPNPASIVAPGVITIIDGDHLLTCVAA